MFFAGLSFLRWLGLDPIPLLSGILGATDPALRLIVSIFMGFIIAIFYNEVVRREDKSKRILFLILTGIDMSFYNYGFSLYHNLIPALVMYMSNLILKPGKYHTIFTLSFNMIYLLVGYYYTETDDYDITWTMPQCVLVLKLVALSFDLWDGDKMMHKEILSANNRKTALRETPELLELIAFVFFPAAYLVGPIFSFKRFKDFIEDEFPYDHNKSDVDKQASKVLIQGVFYLIAYQVGGSYFTMNYMLSGKFQETSIFYRHFYVGVWAHFALYKYISCWLITEASCIKFGLSYNGMDERAVAQWNGCNNIKLHLFETATKFQHYIESFNTNTNYFAAEYIYKRLKFMGNRNISQFCTLAFLAVWHGVQSGYYVTFFNEFIIIYFEKEFESIITQTELYHKIWKYPVAKYVLYVLLKMYTLVFMGWSLAPFDIKVYPKWFELYSSLWFSGFLLFLPWPFIYKPLLKRLIKTLNLKTTTSKVE